MQEDKTFREFLHKTQEKSEEIINSSHIGTDVIENTKDLLQIINMLRNKLDDTSGQSGDMRVLKRRFDQLKVDSQKAIKDVERFNLKVIPQVVIALKQITAQTNIISREHAKTPDSASAKAAQAIESAVQKVIKNF